MSTISISTDVRKLALVKAVELKITQGPFILLTIEGVTITMSIDTAKDVVGKLASLVMKDEAVDKAESISII